MKKYLGEEFLNKVFKDLVNSDEVKHTGHGGDKNLDVRLYMEAEALKNTNRKAEAFTIYSDLINRYPDSEATLLARMTHFMLLLENAQPSTLPKLESVASSLKTVWQKGTAFYKL